MHRIFSGDGWLVFPDILKSARDHCPSQGLLQQPPVLIILCILCIDVPLIVLLDGSAQSRGAGARLAGKREFPKGDRPAFREVARRRFLIHIDAQDAQDFFRRRQKHGLSFPDILKSAHDHALARVSVSMQQPPVLIILCILCIDVPFIVLLDGSAQSRGAGARLAGKREFPKGDRPAFREVARRIPPTSPSGRHPRERGRPARMLSLRLPLSFPAMLQPTALPAGTAWARPKQRQGAAAG